MGRWSQYLNEDEEFDDLDFIDDFDDEDYDDDDYDDDYDEDEEEDDPDTTLDTETLQTLDAISSNLGIDSSMTDEGDYEYSISDYTSVVVSNVNGVNYIHTIISDDMCDTNCSKNTTTLSNFSDDITLAIMLCKEIKEKI